ncbi:MAG TPA: FtsX-like permease family protein [Solirubrobacteraceae bacterium]|jgi:putative ABC transport system permease protein
MQLSSIAHLYRVRLKVRLVLVQELLAVLGLSVGVALLFASQVASASLNGSVQQLASEIVGNMQYQLESRDPRGFDEGMLEQVRRLPGVSAAVPVLEQPAEAIGPSGRESVELIGADPRLALRNSPLLKHFRYVQVGRLRALALPVSVAEAIGAQPLAPIELQIGARTVSVLVGTSLDAAAIGGLASSPVVVTPLAYAQKLTGMPGRVTRIFVRALPGRGPEVRAGLQRLAADRLNVEPANFDVKLFSGAAAPADQGEGLFAGISALVGFLFAFNSMLLTLPSRRGLVAGLRTNGATRLDIVKALLFDALVLGCLAALLGLALGDLLSIVVFRSNPGYLSFAFPVGSQRVVTWQSVAIGAGAGLLAACLGVLIPLREILSPSVRAAATAAARHVRRRWRIVALTAGLACIAVTTAILLAAPQSAVLGSVILVVALLLLLPSLIDACVSVFDRVQSHFGAASTRIAVIELRSPQTRARSLAIAATGAIAVFGSVAIQGAHANLQHGLDRLAHDAASAADLWVVPPGTQDLLGTTPFPGTASPALAALPGVRAVGLYRAGFLDYGDRHIWALAPPGTATHPIPPSQLLEGNLTLATARLRMGGWAVLSQSLAAQHGLRIGQSFTLPSPHPMSFRVAALTTNLGWPPGAIILNPSDYSRAWGSSEPSAYNVMLAPGASLGSVSAEIRQALGSESALTVETARQREQSLRTASRQGLSRLTQIATLVLIATVLAMSIAMGTMIWQRRPRLARMKVQGYERGVLWRALLYESGLLLGAGCLIGAACGIYGQLLISHALATVTGFPIVYSAGAAVAIASFALVSVLAVGVVALLGYRAADVAPYA